MKGSATPRRKAAPPASYLSACSAIFEALKHHVAAGGIFAAVPLLVYEAPLDPLPAAVARGGGRPHVADQLAEGSSPSCQPVPRLPGQARSPPSSYRSWRRSRSVTSCPTCSGR